MPGRHRSPVVLGPGFTRQPIRHANRNRAGRRRGELATTITLMPDDEQERVSGRYEGRHRASSPRQTS